MNMPSPVSVSRLFDYPVLLEVQIERLRQDSKWGGPRHDDQLNIADFVQRIEDYAGWARMMAVCGSPDKARRRLIQVAALAVAAAEMIDRRCVPSSQ